MLYFLIPRSPQIILEKGSDSRVSLGNNGAVPLVGYPLSAVESLCIRGAKKN